MKQLVILIEESEHIKLKKVAKEEGVSVSDFVRNSIYKNMRKRADTPLESLKQLVLEIESKRREDEARRILDIEALRADLKTIYQQAKVTDTKAESVNNFVKSIKDDSKRVLAIQRCNLIYNDELATIVHNIYPKVLLEAKDIAKSN